MESLTVNPRGVVVNDRMKRTSFRGVIDVIDGGERQPEKGAQTGPGGKDQEATVNGSGAGKKGKGKRKIDDKEGNGDGTPQLSKRQAKKMRLEALKAGKELPGSPTDQTPPTDPAGDSQEADTHSTIKTKGNG